MGKSCYRVISVLSIVVLSIPLLCACGQIGNDSASSNSSSGSSSTAAENIPKSESEALGSSFSADQTIYLNLTNLTSTVDGSDDVLITTTKNKYFYDGDGNATVKVDFTKYNDTSNGVIRVDITDVTKATAVHISGSNDAVKGIKIQTSKTYQNGVILDNVTLTSGNFPCVEMTKKGSVNVQLIGTNILTDGRTFGTGYGEEYSTTSGNTYTDDDGNTVDCTIVRSAEPNGSDAKGTLYARGDMTIYGNGTLMVTQSYKNCIASKMILTVEQGTYILTSTGKAGLYGDYAVYMKDGSVTFNGTGEVTSSMIRKTPGVAVDDDTYLDAIISIEGGSLDVTTNSGRGMTAPYLNIKGGTNTVTNTGTTSYIVGTSTVSYYNADGESKSDILNYSPEGVQADTKMTISGGKLYVTANSHEAIETKSTLTISGGEVYAVSSDDAINSAGVMAINGGYVFANSSGNDGIDSNGNMTISGGTIVAVGANGAEVGIDVIENGTLTINGGNIIAVGGLENTNNVSGSAYQASSYNKGTWYGFYNVSGSLIIAFKVPSNSSMGTPMAVYSSTGTPSLMSGVTGSGTEYWNGYGYSECSGGSSVSLSSYTKSSQGGGPGGNSPF